jgi:hypothetical protein
VVAVTLRGQRGRCGHGVHIEKACREMNTFESHDEYRTVQNLITEGLVESKKVGEERPKRADVS